MATKFVIECPRCGKYVEVKTGFFAKRNVDCSCGYVINIKSEKLSNRVCPHCGNNVVYDQSKGDKALCPVCKEPINTIEHQNKSVEFPCEQCGIRLHSVRGVSSYKCPVCDHVNNVVERLESERIKNEGLASIIKYEGDNQTLAWKHPVEDFNYGSQLIVHESQEAIFFRNGQALDLFGSGRYTLETQRLPLMDKLFKLPVDNTQTFHSEVYFVNLATQMGIKWGTDTKVRLFDPATGLHVEIGASGDFNIRVINSRKLLLKLVGTTDGMMKSQVADNGRGFFRSMIMTQVKSYLGTVIRENAISILEIDEHLMELSEALRNKINPKLAEYGLEVSEFYVERIATPDDDANFKRLKQQHADQYLKIREQQILRDEAAASAEKDIVSAKGAAAVKKIEAEAEAEAYRMQAAAEADEMRMKGYTYQQETARQVGLEAMQNGLTGNGDGGVGSGLGDVAGLGLALGAMGSVVNMTKDALTPVMDSTKEIGASVGGVAAVDTWNCACGNSNIRESFCGKCGAKRVMVETWDCSCGNHGITEKFCGKCGAKKPEGPETWDCECGKCGITEKFCGNCGAKKPEAPKAWDCECGNSGIIGNFCGNCGAKKPEGPKTWDCECGNTGIPGNFCPQCGTKKPE